MNQYKTSRSTNDALSLPALKGGVSRAKAMKMKKKKGELMKNMMDELCLI